MIFRHLEGRAAEGVSDAKTGNGQAIEASVGPLPLHYRSQRS